MSPDCSLIYKGNGAEESGHRNRRFSTACIHLRTVCEQSATVFAETGLVQHSVNRVQRTATTTGSNDRSETATNRVVEHKGCLTGLVFWGSGC